MSIYDYHVETVKQGLKDLADYENKVVLIVNTASKCGFVPQLAGLEKLYHDYREQDFIVLGFPCNQFLGQEPKSNEEIIEFCQVNYGVSFPVFAKIDVRGKKQAPLYDYLIRDTGGKKIPWNFTKFLINRQGDVVKRFSPKTEPATLAAEIEALL